MFTGYYAADSKDSLKPSYMPFPMNSFSNFTFQQTPIFQFSILYSNPIYFYGNQPSIVSPEQKEQIENKQIQQNNLDSQRLSKEYQENKFQKLKEPTKNNYGQIQKAEQKELGGDQIKTTKMNESKTRKKYKQNEERNVFTNIGNQLITFLGNKSRSLKVYLRVNPNAEQQETSQFYAFIHKLRRRKKSPIYFNHKKIQQMWYPSNVSVASSKNYQILRQMSLIFIQQILPLFMLNSVRIKEGTKIYHIAVIRKFLYLLRYRKTI